MTYSVKNTSLVLSPKVHLKLESYFFIQSFCSRMQTGTGNNTRKDSNMKHVGLGEV